MGIEHDLPVGDRDQVGRDIGGEIAGIGLGDRQCGQRAAAELGRQLCRALEQARVQVEYVTGIGLAAGWLAGQQRELAVGRGMLGQIVDDDQRVLAVIPEILGDRETRERRDPLQSGRGRRRGDDKDAALGGAVLLHRFDDPPHRGRALADRHIDADDVRVLLIDDRIDADCRLAGGPVTDDQLALAAPDREQGVDHQNARIHRLGHEIAIDNGGRRALDRHLRFGLYRLVTVERPAERIDDAAEQSWSDRDPDDLAGPGHPRSRLDGLAVIEQDGADRVGIEGQRKPHSPAVEAQKLVEAGVRQAGDESDPVADAFDAAHRLGLRGEIDTGDGLAAAREPGVVAPVVDGVRQRLCHGEPARI